ncbi:MAG: hypothetical protein ACREQJ_05550, partial [Candidatus Binatia bacterium]
MRTFGATVRSVGAAFVSVALAVSSAQAFKPNEAGHLGITTEALSPITRTADGQTVQFSDRALDEIRDANRNTDIITFFGVAEHFDDEAFVESSQRLLNLKESTIQKALAGDGDGAREDFGGALHTVQDFYSHSNWVELGNIAIEPRLGREVMQPLPIGDATCGDDFGTLVGAGLTDETTGYFPFPDPCAGPPEGTPAGKCRHGVEFFCPTGLNKDAPGRVGYDAARARAVEATVDYANQILDDPRIATNGPALRELMGAEARGGKILVIEAGLDDAGPKTYDVPVDSTIQRIKFRANVLGLEALRPNGQPVAAGDPGVTIVDEAGTRKIIIDAPPTGLWKARLPQGDGKFTLQVAIKSDLQIEKFAFVTFTGRVGHEGYVPITTEPKEGSTALALTQIVGPIASATFELVNPKGKTIQSVKLVGGDPNASAT